MAKQKYRYSRLSIHKAVLLQNNIFLHNNSLTTADMRQHYLWGLPFLVSKIYYFEVRCSFVVIKILLCRSREMKQGCRLARLFGKSIMDFYARNQYFLMNTQPKRIPIFFISCCFLLFKHCFYCEIAENDNAEDNPVPTEHLEIVLFDVCHKVLYYKP